MGEQYHIAGLPDPTADHEAVNLRTLNQKVLREIRANNLLETQKYLRLDGENQMVSDLQMNDHTPVDLADATAPADGVNKRTLDAAVNSLRFENEQLILSTNENISQRVMFLDGTSLPEYHQNYNDKSITNLGQPVEDTDAATKGFIDNQLRKRTFHVTPEGAQRRLKMNNHQISGLANPTQNNDAAHTGPALDTIFWRRNWKRKLLVWYRHVVMRTATLRPLTTVYCRSFVQYGVRNCENTLMQL